MRATAVSPAGTWSAAADAVVLDYDRRHRRRMAFRTLGGLDFVLDLPRATVLRDGDGLVLEDGRIVRVEAAPEGLLEIEAPDRPTLVRIAWHLGNRHLPTQLIGERLRIREDHVIAEMVRGLGGVAMPVRAPFDPERGAYGQAAGAAHSHAHG